jgi:hypothetical protein
MSFSRVLSFLGLKKELKDKLQDVGLEEQAAHRSAYDMNPGDLSQAARDLARVPKFIMVDEAAETTVEIDDTADLENEDRAREFLTQLAQGNEAMLAYLERYCHQGGFMNASELLLTYFFRTELEDEDKILINTEGRTAKFILHADGSLSYEESFDIDEIKTTGGVDYKAPDGPIASVKLRSKISIKDGRVQHEFEDVKVETHDKAAKKLFDDPRGPIMKFLSWLVDAITSVFSKAAREHNQHVSEIPNPRKKL